jgi:hypothetical protein
MADWGLRRGEVWGGGVRVGRQAEASCRDDKLALFGCSIEMKLVMSVISQA